jgi:hypothetical protein
MERAVRELRANREHVTELVRQGFGSKDFDVDAELDI